MSNKAKKQEMIHPSIPLVTAAARLADQQPHLSIQSASSGGQSKISAANIAASLQVRTPAQTNRQFSDKPISNETAPDSIRLIHINRVDFYDGNPRKYHDAESYAGLKESIRAVGIKQPVHITKRPGHGNYMLCSGGNTRLRIMKELYAETHDEKYSLIPCIYQSYVSEKAIHFAHLIENEMHFEMCFWDKANAYAAGRQILEQETVKNLGLRELAKQFEENGATISHTLLGLLLFAYDNLAALKHLAVYLSNPKTKELRKTYTQYKNLSADKNLFDECWRQTLSAWADDHTHLTDIDLNDLSDHVEQTIFSNFPEMRKKIKELSLPSPDLEDEDPIDPGINEAVDDNEDAPSLPQSDKQKLKQRQNGEKPPMPLLSLIPTSRDEALQSIHQLVKQMLQHIGLEDLFIMHHGFNYGFYVEYPDFETITQTDEFKAAYERGNKAYMMDYIHDDARDVIYFLMDLSQQDDMAFETIVNQLPESSCFKKSINDEHYCDDITLTSMGDKPLGSTYIIKWACFNSPLRDPFFGLLNAVFLFNKFHADK